MNTTNIKKRNDDIARLIKTLKSFHTETEAEEFIRQKFEPMFQPQPMKLCIHCRHHSATPSEHVGGMEMRIDLCCRPGHWNPVVGGYYSRSALDERIEGPCGMDGRFWEPKVAK